MKSNNCKKNKSSKGFNDSLTIISLFSFIVIVLESFTEVDLNPWATSFFLIVAGAGLAVEGQIATANKWLKDGLQKNEFAMFFTMVFGLLAVFVGVLISPAIGIVSPKLDGIVGFMALFSGGVIAWQRWVV